MRLKTPRLLLVLLVALCTLPDARARAAGDETALIVERIECRGNVITPCDFIRGRLYSKVGGELNENEIGDAKLRLSSLPNFKSVSIYLEKGSAKGYVIVVIEVAEANPFTTAFLFGDAYRQNQPYQTFAARLSDLNWLGSGKSVDLLLVGTGSVTGASQREYAARLDYFDPQLLDSSRYFLYGGLFYSRAGFQLPFGGSSDSSGAGLDVSVGRRFGSFSYGSIGYRYVFDYPSLGPFLASDGTITALTNSPKRGVLLTYGRSTEDDPVFPTDGWMFHLYDVANSVLNLRYAGAQLRATWRGNGGYWTVQARPFNDFKAPFDDELGLSLSYSHNIDFGDGAGRGRWYLGPGLTPLGDAQLELGLKAGVRFETRHFGVVNLYLIGSEVVRRPLFR